MFARIKLYLFFALAFWLFRIPVVQKVLNSSYLVTGIIGLIVFLLLIAAFHTVRVLMKRRQKNKTKEDDTHLFL